MCKDNIDNVDDGLLLDKVNKLTEDKSVSIFEEEEDKIDKIVGLLEKIVEKKDDFDLDDDENNELLDALVETDDFA